MPNLPGGAEIISVTDGTNVATSSFSITPNVAITFTGNNFGFPEESIVPTIAITGFASGETVTIATAPWTTTSYSCNTGLTLGTFGACSATGGTSVADTTGGTKTITATGGTSGLSATTTYTVNPWAAFYTATSGAGTQTVFAFQGTAPTSILIEAHGLPSGTLAANSITIGGVATSHSSVTIGSTGAFGGMKAALVVAPTAQVPFGPVSVVIDGTTFSYAAGNIASAAGVWGGALISSVQGTVSSTAVISTDATTYQPGGYAASTTSTAPVTSQVGVFGYGVVPTDVVTITSPSGATLAPITVHLTATASGAIFGTYSLADTAYSSASTPTTAASYTIGVTGTGTANTLPPSFGVTPWIAPQATVLLGSPLNYESSIIVTVHGFSNTETVTAKIGGASFLSGGTCTTGATGTCSTAASRVPDLAGGVQTTTATGALSGQTATGATPFTGGVTYLPIADFASGTTLSIVTGGAGSTTVIRTGNGYGVHGLAANTAYNIVWNAIGGSTTLGTFTSTATGGIPIPGVQVTIPSDTSGIHIFDIQTSSGVSAFFGNTLGANVAPTEAPFLGAYGTAYGDLLFSNVALLQAAPSVATVGVPETLSGTGLASGASYVVSLCNAVSCPAALPSTSIPALATFTATSTGAVPSNVAITLADTPTSSETGTVMYFAVQTAAHFGVVTATDAYAQVVLAASASDNMTSAPTGHPVTLTAHALNPTSVYDIIFNYAPGLIAGSYSGTTVGVLAPNSVGAGSVVWDVPATAASGTYTVQLVVASKGATGNGVGTAALDNALSITVGSVSTSTCNTTACMGSTGSTVTQVGTSQAVETGFTNTSTAPVTAIVFAVVHNALGQTVSYSTATVSAAAGGSTTAYNVLYGLAPGTYSVTIFATSSAGTAISTSSTVSVTIP